MEKLYLFKINILVDDSLVDEFEHMKFSHFQTALVSAATMQCKIYGIDIESLLKKGLTWVISKIRIKFNSIPKLGDMLTIETWPIKSGKLVFDRDFRVKVGKKIVATASSRWCVIDVNTRKPVRSDLIFSFNDCKAKTTIISDPFVNEIEKFNNFNETIHKVMGDEIDINNHLNNAKYYNMALAAIKDIGCNLNKIREVFFHYLKESLVGDEIVLKSTNFGKTYYVFGYRNNLENDIVFEFNAIVE